MGALKILEAHYSSTGIGPTGRVSDGFLKVSGLLVQAVVGETSPASNIWQTSWHWPKQPWEIQNVKFLWMHRKTKLSVRLVTMYYASTVLLKKEESTHWL